MVQGYIQEAGIDSGISMEYAATVTPQQIGMSENDGRTIAIIGRCLVLIYFLYSFILFVSPSPWDDFFFTTVSISNNSPHFALERISPYSKMYNEETNMTDLHAIGARPFVHIETHTPKLRDRAWERKLCGSSHKRRAYRIFNAPKGTVVESRNVNLLGPPPYVLL